ncbi:MAG: glycerophosphodiester phosphodiesterase [Pirellulales bacterium]
MKLNLLTIAFLLTTLASARGSDPILVAHRGLLRHAPENTLPAFATCLELGMGFELDIRTTKDDKLVVLHDDTLGRTTDGANRSVREFTLAAVKKFDAGSWFHPSFSQVHVPTLEETFALIERHKRGRTIIALNVKDVTTDGEKRLVQLVDKYGLFDDSFAFGQTAASSHRLEELNPKLRIGANVTRQTVDSRLQEGLLDVFLVTFVPTPAEVEQLHQRGKQVVYNFGGRGEARRNPSAWTKAKQAGTDGMLTDYPLECRLHWRKEKNTTSDSFLER